MRGIVTILSIFVLIAGSCGQVTKKQTETAAEDTFVEDTELFETQNTYDNSLFDLKKIDSETYFALKEKAPIPTTSLEVITDFEQAKEMLKGQIIWGRYDYETHKFVEDEQEESKAVYKIVFRNGKTHSCEYGIFFIAYYPQEDILLLEGEHDSDVSFNLTTGEEIEDIGNPKYFIFSPSKQYKLNGYDNGQAAIYFIQEKSEATYKTVIELDYSFGSELATRIGFIPECFGDMFWQNDTILNFVVLCSFYPENKPPENFYYQLILK